MLLSRFFCVAFTTFILQVLIFGTAFAQDGDKDKGPHQVGGFIGRLLPNGISDDDEILALSGLRYSIPSGQHAYYDFGGLFGNSEGVKWQGAFAGVRMDIPVETLIGHAGVGLDFTRLEFSDGVEEDINEFGLHFVGGLITKIGGNSFFRFDMKINSRPGTSLYFALGIMIELEEGTDNN